MDRAAPFGLAAVATAPANIQTILLPGLDFGVPEDMYVRGNDRLRFALATREVKLRDGGHLRFDTYFNGITVAAWKRQCDIADLTLTLRGSGTFLLRFGLHRIGHAHRWLSEQTIQIPDHESCSIRLDFWPELDGGMLYFTLEALGPASLSGGAFSTRALPCREVRLGIVITHFNRKNHVLPAIARLRDKLLGDPHYRGRIELLVVDNSRNIAAEEAAGIRLLPNPNFGGSGGFMRGLLELIDDGGFTHCLFMDDDASCEVESIRRAYALLQFVASKRTAVAGALLRVIEPFRLFEKGAQFDGSCKPLKQGLDMRNIGDLLWAEFADRQPDYGGWWFFAFAIREVKHFAFPFFVRGDDIQFSMLNKFDLLTLNGIGCWGEDFGLKNGPLPVYLDLRNHILQKLCVLDDGLVSTARLAVGFFMYLAMSYNYAAARCVTLALRDVAKGPAFWSENMDMASPRAEIGSFAAAEKLVELERGPLNVTYRGHHESRRRRLLRRLTLNGFLLPNFLLHDRTVFQHKGFAGALRETFRFKRVLYEYEPLGVGYLAVHDKPAFFKELFHFTRTLAAFALNFAKLRRAYLQALPEMTSEAFWRRQYDLAGQDLPNGDR